MALSIRQKRVRRTSGDPVHGVVVQGPVDGLATGTPLYIVAVQGTIDGRTTCRPRGWRFGTWNVGTLTGRSLEVVEELQRRMVDVAALQEIRWKGEGTRFVGAKGGRYKLCWKGDDGTGGVGVMVREELVEKNVIVVVMVFGKVIVRVISGYAPQQSRKEEEKDRFYDDVSDEIGQAGLNEFVVLLGDLNGHVGADADGYEGVHGGWGYGIRNEEGRRVLELADAHSMVVGYTWFTREPARLITYRSGEHTMIDYILVRAKHRKYVKNVKAIPGMLQHSMVVMNVTSKEMGRRKKDNGWEEKSAGAAFTLWNSSQREIRFHCCCFAKTSGAQSLVANSRFKCGF
ncbi:hypothetical protein HELRODRAFT_167641 [Helobdella robusta]|uniref:Endonuclease/exonuclease/phosphatase domain-containing protein n=1 Tax=Helobdella robusta TaxID=6412 RepID=T1EZL6_HELRO|nr:hypothetical protein HELRODRAFT_167641 [Helobdella robusta]ESO09831.1 hypothetical protein HELRODRAFT_167641 [Helobdella robusta]